MLWIKTQSLCFHQIFSPFSVFHFKWKLIKARVGNRGKPWKSRLHFKIYLMMHLPSSYQPLSSRLRREKHGNTHCFDNCQGPTFLWLVNSWLLWLTSLLQWFVSPWLVKTPAVGAGAGCRQAGRQAKPIISFGLNEKIIVFIKVLRGLFKQISTNTIRTCFRTIFSKFCLLNHPPKDLWECLNVSWYTAHKLQTCLFTLELKEAYKIQRWHLEWHFYLWFRSVNSDDHLM